ncbi:hypothetical protein JCM10021v2_005296 [Rhodotorula toruloides]
MSAARTTPRKDPALDSPEETVYPLANPPTSLLDLPDELILRIFERLAHTRFWPERSFIGYISLNRRVYCLCQHLLFYDVVLPDDEESREYVLAKLLLREESLKALYTLLGSFPALERLILSLNSFPACWPTTVTTKSECALKYPPVFALLHLLSETKIIDFRVRWPKEQKELRWTRILGDAEWDNERFTWEELPRAAMV